MGDPGRPGAGASFPTARGESLLVAGERGRCHDRRPPAGVVGIAQLKKEDLIVLFNLRSSGGVSSAVGRGGERRRKKSETGDERFRRCAWDRQRG